MTNFRSSPESRLRPRASAAEPSRMSGGRAAHPVDRRPEATTLTEAGRLPTGLPNRTGLPDTLKSGIESLSGISLDGVRVHRNSSAPARLQAHAYAQGTEIHVGPGQEQHLPHEAWHIVQQAQGRVAPTVRSKTGVSVNKDRSLEQEADVMGLKAERVAQLHGETGLVADTGAPDRSAQS
jgi:hypothetical protein